VGDLGEVAYKSKGRQRTMFKPKSLTVKVRVIRCHLSSSLEQPQAQCS
jgi:hypothetical protein